MKRLNYLKLDSSCYYGLNLNLSETNQIDLFEDILFLFLIQKKYTQNGEFFCYQGNVHIKIEISKGFYNFLEKFMIL